MKKIFPTILASVTMILAIVMLFFLGNVERCCQNLVLKTYQSKYLYFYWSYEAIIIICFCVSSGVYSLGNVKLLNSIIGVVFLFTIYETYKYRFSNTFPFMIVLIAMQATNFLINILKARSD